MKKSKLQTGMVIRLRDKSLYILLRSEVGMVGINQKMNSHLSLTKFNEYTLKNMDSTETFQDLTQECENGHISKVITIDGTCPLCGSKIIKQDVKEIDINVLKDRSLDIVEIYSPKLNNDIGNFEQYKGFLAPVCWELMKKIWERTDKD